MKYRKVYGLLTLYPNFTVKETKLFDSDHSRNFHIANFVEDKEDSWRCFEYEIEDCFYF